MSHNWRYNELKNVDKYGLNDHSQLTKISPLRIKIWEKFVGKFSADHNDDDAIFIKIFYNDTLFLCLTENLVYVP